MESQEWEKNWWGTCQNTYGEETKQIVYAQKMGLEVYNDGSSPFNIRTNKKIMDIGGGPVSMLLKTKTKGIVIDPCDYPSWVAKRYRCAGIHYCKIKGEDYAPLGIDVDEVWIYNVLQHVENPEKIINKARKAAPIIRLFEWINIGIDEGHPHTLTRENLDKWLGGYGRTEFLNESGCIGECYYGVFNGDKRR